MLAGERTQERPGEYESGSRVAPFLMTDLPTIEKLFFETMVHEANVFFSLVTLQKSIYTSTASDFSIADPAIRRIAEQGSRFAGS